VGDALACERKLANAHTGPAPARTAVGSVRAANLTGDDPLDEAISLIRPAHKRRDQGRSIHLLVCLARQW
jgi:hypothetical protein